MVFIAVIPRVGGRSQRSLALSVGIGPDGAHSEWDQGDQSLLVLTLSVFC